MATDETEHPDPAGLSPTLKIGLVLIVIAAAHVGAYMLLTAGARKDVRNLEAEFGRHELVVAIDPGMQPIDASKFRDWSKRQARWEARETWLTRGEVVSAMGYALMASFVLQAGFILLISFKTLSRAAR
jgi:hypothetical protein